jgi:multidrug efflux pump
MTANVAYDSSVFIDRSIDAVFKTIGEAMLLVLLIIFFFLRNFRATLIPLVTIPVSLIGAFALMLVLGFTINTLTLLALVLAIGLVVDDAIVVLENIYRHIEQGMPRRQAAFQGAQEIGFAVVAMTITLAAVYAPVAFMTGRTGKLFVEFALTLAGAVLVSGFVALTLSPMMCSLLLKHETRHGKAYVCGSRTSSNCDDRTAIAGAHRSAGAALAGDAGFRAGRGAERAAARRAEVRTGADRRPRRHPRRLPRAGRRDARLHRKYGTQLEDIYANTADVERYFVVSGNPTVSQGISFVGLTDWSERERNSAAWSRSCSRNSWASRACSPSRCCRRRSGRVRASGRSIS